MTKPRASSQFTRQALYDWLDLQGVPFRSSVDDLVGRFGTVPNPWHDDERDVLLTCDTALLQHLADPPSVTLDDLTLHRQPARRIQAYLREHDNARRNVALMERQITSLFGPPTESYETNAVVHNWLDPDDPACALRLMGFLDPFDTTNRRHTRIPGAASEAALVISPDYSPPLTVKEREILADLHPVLPDATHDPFENLNLGHPDAGLCRARIFAGGVDVPHGLWRCGSGDYLVACAAGGRFAILPMTGLKKIELNVLLPARGGGGASLRLLVTWAPRNLSVSVAGGVHNDPTLEPLGRSLAQRLDLPFDRFEQLDW